MDGRMRITIAAAMTTAIVWIGTAAGGAEPERYHGTIHERKVTHVFPIEEDPACPIGAGTVTAIETVAGHLFASIDRGDPNDPNDDALVPPARVTLNMTSKVTFEPDDPSLPTYTGHSGMHFAWDVGADGIGVARIERTIVMKATDRSRYFLHLVGRAVFDLSQADSDNEGLVEITMEKLSCGN